MKNLKSVLLFSSLMISTSLAQRIVVLTDCGAVDPDDFIAAVTIYQACVPTQRHELSFVTEHVEPHRKRDALEALLGDVDVYVGEGYSRGDAPETYQTLTPAFPFHLFGSIIQPAEAKARQKVWHPKHLEAFQELVDQVPLKRSKQNGVEHLIAQAAQCTPKDPLIVMSLAPMLTLAAALKKRPDLGGNIVVYAMGGAEEENRAPWHTTSVGTAQQIKKPGYNWGISPEQTAFVLGKVQKMVVMPSQLPRDLWFAITEQNWVDLEPFLKSTKEGLTFLQERINCKGQNALKEQMMCDPLTVVVGLAMLDNPNSVPLTPAKVTWPWLDEEGQIRQKYRGVSYLDPRAKNMMKITKSTALETNIFFVQDVPFHESAKQEVLNSLKQHFASDRLLASL